MVPLNQLQDQVSGLRITAWFSTQHREENTNPHVQSHNQISLRSLNQDTVPNIKIYFPKRRIHIFGKVRLPEQSSIQWLEACLVLDILDFHWLPAINWSTRQACVVMPLPKPQIWQPGTQQYIDRMVRHYYNSHEKNL